jgi:predicted lipid-binding transport protein (Tim44 family)
MKRTLLFLVVMGFVASVSAQQYRWVDKDGRVQYGDTPPPGVKATRLKPPSGGSTAAPSSSAAKKDAGKALSPEAAFQKRQKEAKEQDEKAARERAEADVRKANCDAAQAALRQIQSGQRIATMNSAGERVFLDDSARAAEEARGQRAVSENCK